MAADQTYARFVDLPLDELVPLTALTGDPHRYGDFAEGSYCSTCGKNSANRARADLWMMRREWGDTFHTRFYCREHFPDGRADGDGGGHSRQPIAEVTCRSCFLRTPSGDDCSNCGASLAGL